MARRLIVLIGLLAAACGGGSQGSGADAAIADAAPNNALLADLSTSAGSLEPPFEPGVTPVAADPGGVTITVDGAPVASGRPGTVVLDPGARDVLVVVTAAGGAVTTYQVHILRGIDALSGLRLSSSGGELTTPLEPVF